MTKLAMGWSGWVVATLVGGCIALPEDEEGNGEGAIEDTVGETGGEASSSISGTASMTSVGSTDSWPTSGSEDSGNGSSATMGDSISTTDTCGSCTEPSTGESGTPGDDPLSVCGVDIVHDPTWDNYFVCGCEACEVEFHNLEPASGNALIEACDCICYEIGCGGSVSGGATSNGGGESGWDTGDTFAETGEETATSSAGGSTDPTSDTMGSTTGE